MAGWKMSLVALVVLADLANAQRSQSSAPVFSANSLGSERAAPDSFKSLLSRLTSESSNNLSNSILTSVNTPSVSLGSIGSSLGKSSNSGSRTSISSSAIPLFSAVPSATVSKGFGTSRESSFNPSIPLGTLTSKPPINPVQEPNVVLELEFPQADPVDNNIIPVEETRSSQIEDKASHLSLEEMSSILPELIELMSDPSTSSSEVSSINSLLSVMTKAARQQTKPRTQIPGGVDFSQATRTADGRLCVIKEETVESLSKDPILECTHKNVEKCHYTYITLFNPAQQEECEENFEKSCQITFRQEASRETVRKCYRPQQKVCNGQGPEQCRTVYESSCTTKYVEKEPGKFVGDTSCEKLPVEICGQGCVIEEGEEECHDKQIDTVVDIPEEICDLNPQKTCRLVTRLVPSLKPERECTIVPKETCNLKFSQPVMEKKPLRTEWCLDETPTASDSASQGVQPRQPATQAPNVDFEFPEAAAIPPVESAPSDYRTNLVAELRRLKRLGIM